MSFSSFSTAIFLLLIIGVLPESCKGIIGGKEAQPHSRRYMVLIKGLQICAGTLIKENWVLTSARCNLKDKPKIILGAHSASHKEKLEQVFSIKKAIPYPCYDSESFEGDLQLLELNNKATMTKAVEVLPLPKSGEDLKPNTKCQVAGWGSVKKESCEASAVLREVNVTVMSRKVCNNAKHYNSKPLIQSSMICAGGKKGQDESCEGDTGGPLICGNIFRGITSFGKCGNSKKPGVYTLLTNKYLNWIHKTVAGVV